MDLETFKAEDSSYENQKREEGEVNESPYLKLISVIAYFVKEFKEMIIDDEAAVELFPKHLTNYSLFKH